MTLTTEESLANDNIEGNRGCISLSTEDDFTPGNENIMSNRGHNPDHRGKIPLSLGNENTAGNKGQNANQGCNDAP